MEQPSKFQHQLQPDKPSSSTMSPSPHPEQTPPWGALWVLALGLAKAASSSTAKSSTEAGRYQGETDRAVRWVL